MSFELWLLVCVITSAFGMGYFVYGKKQGQPVPLVTGIVLMAYTYFVDSLVWSIVIGVVLIVLPFVVKTGD